ncbi:hypothetical protein GCM10010207_66360 [Streptomyces atratus]|nr:hypothetical protein GCM10010207_66360 [Streptomyces atratus]
MTRRLTRKPARQAQPRADIFSHSSAPEPAVGPAAPPVAALLHLGDPVDPGTDMSICSPTSRGGEQLDIVTTVAAWIGGTGWNLTGIRTSVEGIQCEHRACFSPPSVDHQRAWFRGG